ncbi:MAG: hypothetical protein CM1200mP18_21380 [Gammaproteobacteria bacterium]|nr:MAG: hypothetical protein CM1200mP18_21380 [Gammaproteobacteria bacterium]
MNFVITNPPHRISVVDEGQDHNYRNAWSENCVDKGSNCGTLCQQNEATDSSRTIMIGLTRIFALAHEIPQVFEKFHSRRVSSCVGGLVSR